MAKSYPRKPGNWNDFEELVKSLNRIRFTRIKLLQPKKRG
jgi:hypothetical protein